MKRKIKEALEEAKKLEREEKEVRSLKQLEKDEENFEKEKEVLKKSIGKLKYKKK